MRKDSVGGVMQLVPSVQQELILLYSLESAATNQFKVRQNAICSRVSVSKWTESR